MIIGICDDQKVYRDYIRKICENIKRESTENWDIVEFTDGLQLLKCSMETDILILDIEMPEVDGIQVKDLFQSRQQNTVIIYVTSHAELMQQAFGIHVLGFVEKENMEFQLPKILKQAFSLYETNVIVEKKYNSREICYVEASHVYCCIHMKDSSVGTVRTSMKELEMILEPVGFIKIQRSYMVNMAWVESIKGQTIILKENHGQLPVSYRNRKIVKERYMKYCKEQGRYY
ncbi:MAG: response regulator transcription factor [Lachnospiraceae bacterium]|nr:response regulator transcription factor [Lachnospiraceae bacterium]